MRVVHVSPTTFGASGLFGGGERYPLELARALARRVECKLVTFGSRASSFRDGNLDVTVLERVLLVGGHPAHPIARGFVHQLEDADVIHAHHLRALPSRVAGLLGKIHRRPRVVTDHGLGRGRSARLDTLLFDRFLTVSRYSAATLSVPSDRTTVIYGGVDTDRFRPGRHERAGVLFVGRLTPHKGLDRLIQALPGDTSLTLAGTFGHDPEPPARDYRSLLLDLARSRDVRLLEAVSDDDLPHLYRRARVVVLPSVEETRYGKKVAISELLGLALLEAMASGTPVVASNLGGLPEVVHDGETGFLVEPGNVAELKARLERLLLDDRLAAEMGDNARRHVVGTFTWEKCAERCLAVYEELIGAL
jgi:glycosyltransferase involved in cell wall biosynthesis